MTKENEFKILGVSDSFVDALERASQLTDLNRPVLIVGERGTGKELVAERLHYLSNRWSKPLIKTNCAAISESLLESELFGHEAGAFTGANRRHLGRFERAHGGSLFLDELATLNPSAQEKLLRIIEYGEFERLGGSEPIAVDTRLIAATNIDLPRAAENGGFRPDLLDRLAFDVITLPPLRARREDILILAEHFALKMCKELNRSLFPGFTPEAERQLTEFSWPGNVRELKNVVERSVYRHESEKRALHNIIFDPFDSPFRPVAESREARPEAAAPSSGQAPHHSLPLNWAQWRNEQEVELIKQALEAAQYNQKEASNMLDLSYHQFRNLLKKHSIQTRGR